MFFAVVLWMTGGPGCSSELAVFYENGPYSINDDMSLSETEYGWDRFHTTIFVDQPINTGFSYSEVRCPGQLQLGGLCYHAGSSLK
jgi:serine carboxypeptidase-like clade IV